MKSKLVIDPGIKGGIVFSHELSPQMKFFEATAGEYEALKFIKSAISASPDLICYIEKVGGYIPDEKGNGQPGSRMFVFGDNYGCYRGILMTLGIETKFVLPQVWQKGINLGKGKLTYAQRKTELRKHAQKLFPGVKVTPGIADALGMLHYARSVEAMNLPVISKKNKPPREKLSVAIIEEELKTILDTEGIHPLAEMSFKKQSKLAIAWCEANGYNVPAKGTLEFTKMFDYWLNLAINGEA